MENAKFTLYHVQYHFSDPRETLFMYWRHQVSYLVLEEFKYWSSMLHSLAVDFQMVLGVLESLFVVFVKSIQFISSVSRFNVAFNILKQRNSTRKLLSFNEIERDILDLLIYVYVLPIAELLGLFHFLASNLR